MKAVTAENLTKVYERGKKAVDGVSFALDAGEIFGVLGPNGAGKTTSVKLLNGMLTPTDGACAVFGVDPAARPDAVHQMAGVVTEHAQMYDNMTGLDNLIFYGALFGVSDGERARRARALLEELGLEDAAGKRLAAYSTGMRQRLSLARALMHQPRILFLDEPTSGLDPESAKSVNAMIARLARENGTTVFLCTHQLRYAQEICTRYGLLDEGALLASGDIAALRALVFPGVTVTLRAGGVPGGLGLSPRGEGAYETDVASEDDIPPLIRRVVEGGGDVYHVSARQMSLEEIYFTLIERRKGRRNGEGRYV